MCGDALKYYETTCSFFDIANGDPKYDFPNQVDYRTIKTEFVLDKRSEFFFNNWVLHISWMKPIGIYNIIVCMVNCCFV